MRSASVRTGVISALVAVLVGCGAQSGAIPKFTSEQNGAHQRPSSWMLPAAKTEDLLYVADSASGVYVFTYPNGKQVGLLAADVGGGLCSDKGGNLFVTDFGGERVVEYAHGGTKPIATLLVNGEPWDCSVDAVTGNLATVNSDTDGTGSVTIFTKATGKGTTYTDPGAAFGSTCSYDNAGNLFVSAGFGGARFVLAELPYGDGTFRNIAVNGDFRGGNFIQWDGSYVAVTNANPKQSVVVSQVEVTGSTASVAGTTRLHGSYGYVKYFWIQGNRLITPLNGGGPRARKLGLWRYPAGGNASTVMTIPKGKYSPGIALGITVSVAPTASRTRK
jgi:hypothetical protein